MADNKSSEGMISKDLINSEGVNIPDVIKGLKAIQREAKKATASLRELEEQKKKNMSLPTGHELNCRRCGDNNLKLQSLGKNIKGVKLVCADCGARQ